MTAQAYPAWLDADLPGDSNDLVRRMLLVSLALHLLGLALAGVGFPRKAERLQATEVTLVSLSQPEKAPAPEPVEAAPAPEPVEEKPTPEPVESAPPPQPVQPTPPTEQPARPALPPLPAVPKMRASAPIASEEPVLPSVRDNMALKSADNRLRDALRGIERPPEAPRLGEYQRAPVPVPPVASTKPQEKPQEKQPTLSELARQLEEVQRPQPKAAVASKPKTAEKPATAIRITGEETGLSRYLAMVQGKISEQWVAPPVDVGKRLYKVVIKFQLHRSGRVSGVVIERESGNGYYDDAGKRAVLSVGQLPPFPPYVAEEMLETHFSFTVGEEVG